MHDDFIHSAIKMMSPSNLILAYTTATLATVVFADVGVRSQVECKYNLAVSRSLYILCMKFDLINF